MGGCVACLPPLPGPPAGGTGESVPPPQQLVLQALGEPRPGLWGCWRPSECTSTPKRVSALCQSRWGPPLLFRGNLNRRRGSLQLSNRLLVFVYQPTRGTGPQRRPAAFSLLPVPVQGGSGAARRISFSRGRRVPRPSCSASPAKGRSVPLPVSEGGTGGQDSFLCVCSRPALFPPRRAGEPGAGSAADNGQAQEGDPRAGRGCGVSCRRANGAEEIARGDRSGL